jgi:trk system potassium uptake protein TrkH
MHKRFVFNIISRTLLIECFTMLIPLGWAASVDLHSREVMGFVLAILAGGFASTLFLWLFRIDEEDYEKINAKDGLAIVGLAWVCLSALGALPLYFGGVVSSYTDAFFEIVSGFTTTGATIFADIESLPKGILFWRSFTQWLGGMGIIVLYLALLPALGSNAYQLYKAEASGITVEKITPRIRETAKNLWSIYFLLSFISVVLLVFAGMPAFDALCHTFSAIATGGFSTKNASIGAYNVAIQWIIIVVMFLGGVNFSLHYLALRGRRGLKAYFKNEEFRLYFYLIFVSILVFTAVLWMKGGSAASFQEAAFQVVSIGSTTGFMTADYNSWHHGLQFILVALMFIGGCGGSTAGGLKIVRFILTIKVALQSGVQSIFPNAVLPIKFNAQPLSDKVVLSILSYFVIFVFLFFGGSVLLTITESCDLITAFSGVIAALSSVGPGLAEVGPTQNYGWISIPGKWLLTFLMLAGRLELYAFLILFLPETWRK